MPNTSLAIDLLVESTQQYRSSKIGEAAALLHDLDLFVDICEVPSPATGPFAMFIGEINASAAKGETGIIVTCVGTGTDVREATASAIGQWALGVLPVLEHWRGKHSCLASPSTLETRGGSFELVAGPIMSRGFEEDAAEIAPDVGGSAPLLIDALRRQRLTQKLHWLEMFSCKTADGSVDSTCRLDNRDWAEGKRLLAGAASAWPAAGEPLRTLRQFTMMLPSAGTPNDAPRTSFWSRLLGRS